MAYGLLDAAAGLLAFVVAVAIIVPIQAWLRRCGFRYDDDTPAPILALNRLIGSLAVGWAGYLFLAAVAHALCEVRP